MEQKHAVITGGSSGIGLAIAYELAKQGHHITIMAREQKKIDGAIKKIQLKCVSKSQEIKGLSVDVCDYAEVEKVIEHLLKNCQVPILLITSAGNAYPGYFEQLPIEKFQQLMQVNYFGSLYVIKAALPYLRHNKESHIVLVSSTAGLMGIFGYSAYTPSKFAVSGLAEVLRAELRRYQITISILYPPDTDTPQLHEENKVKPPETKVISESAGIWTAEDVAKLTVKGIKKKKFKITPGIPTTLLFRLGNLIKPLLNWHFDRLLKRNF